MPQQIKTTTGKVDLFTVDEVAKVTAKHRNTTLSHITGGVLEAQMIGKKYFITRESLNSYLKKRFKLPESIINHRLNKKEPATNSTSKADSTTTTMTT